MNRRGFLKASLTTSTCAAMAMSLEEEKLLGHQARPVGAPIPTGNSLPKGKIKDLEMSRVICGGNLIGGWAHSRELMYVSALVKAYHTDEKVFETLALAEENGIDAILTNPVCGRVINEYWKQGGKIKWISDCAKGRDIEGGIQESIDNGAHACYVQGGIADAMFQTGQVDAIGKFLELIKSHDVPAGIGAHLIETVEASVQRGYEPDFWVKTLHEDDYFTATPEDERLEAMLPPHDNMWCTDSKECVSYMSTLEQPWIAFKVLAAGAIPPKRAFRYAFEQGADFICAGMFDWQVVEDANIAREILADEELEWVRPRPWMG
jgi:hypothetical protein